MAKWGKATFNELIEFRDMLDGIADSSEICEKVANDLAQRFLNVVQNRNTHPVKTGWLRKNWLVGKSYNNGKSFFVIVKNDVKYASYVEYGHRIFVGKTDTGKFASGKFMMTNAIQKVQEIAPTIAQRKAEQYLREKMNGK